MALGRIHRKYLNTIEWCRKYAIFQILGLIAVFIAALSFWLQYKWQRQEAQDQRKEKHYRAWQIINSAQGKGGSGGRIQALEELNREGVSLDGVNLSGDNNTIVSNNYIANNGGHGIWTNSNDGIITSNRSTGNTQYGIYLTGDPPDTGEPDATDNIASLNNCKGNTGGSITNNGTNTILQNNQT